MCKLCNSDKTFHVNDVSFDTDVSTVEGQRDVRRKLIDFSLSGTINLERWLDRLDAVIPINQHKILNMSSKTVRIVDKAVYYLDVEYYDPELAQRVEQVAYLAQRSIFSYHSDMLQCVGVKDYLEVKDIEEGDIIEYSIYVSNGKTVDPRDNTYLTSKFCQPRRKKSESNIIYLTPRDLNEPEDKVDKTFDEHHVFKKKILWPNLVLVGGLLTALGIALHILI